MTYCHIVADDEFMIKKLIFSVFPQGLRVVELDANLLSGRLTGMLFADQGPNSKEHVLARKNDSSY